MPGMKERHRIELRITRELKDQADAVCEARGSNLSQEIRAFLDRLVKRADKAGSITQESKGGGS